MQRKRRGTDTRQRKGAIYFLAAVFAIGGGNVTTAAALIKLAALYCRKPAAKGVADVA
jgi:hypothetical protein